MRVLSCVRERERLTVTSGEGGEGFEHRCFSGCYLHPTEILVRRSLLVFSAKSLRLGLMYSLFGLIQWMCCVKPSSVPDPATSTAIHSTPLQHARRSLLGFKGGWVTH